MAINVQTSNAGATRWSKNPSSTADKFAEKENSPLGANAASKRAPQHTGANTHSPLAGLQAAPSNTLHHEDFTASAAGIAARNRKRDNEYASLAGVPPVGETQMPSALAERYALDALAQVMEHMNALAGEFAVPTATAMLSGKPENMSQLQVHIDKFLAQARATMGELANKIERELPQPTSDQMRQVLHFAKLDIWSGIEQMQANIHKAFQTPVPGPAGLALPDNAQRSTICRHYCDKQVQTFQGQIDVIQKGRKHQKPFDTSQLLGLAAMQKELKAAQALVESQSKASASAKPPRDMSAAPDEEIDFGMDDSDYDGDDKNDEPGDFFGNTA